MFSDRLSAIHFWGWQLIIVLAALTLPLGFTTSKEYAELEWPIDLLITGVWVVFGWNMLGTVLRRRERHMYVSIWFYLATFITVALLHVVNSLELPVSLLKSYSMYAGVQDALVQWWYGHNAVAFFLTTPFLGMMYYFIPKAANRPVFSYRLSIVHFWSLIFLYIWAGPHHLLYTALPDWAQSLGTVFSIMLIAPSWGGMVNGLLTLRGAWDRVREDPVLKFMVVGVTAYGMATFEGPMLSLKNVNALTHYTDYIIGHVHLGALAWNGGLAFAMLYYIVPRIYRTKLYSVRLANVHFWLATLGILFYAIPMYVGGITQSLMWQEFTADGALRYPNFLETVVRLRPMYALRAVGGTLFMLGALVAVYNLYRTARQGSFLAERGGAGAAAAAALTAAPAIGLASRARIAAGAVRGADVRRRARSAASSSSCRPRSSASNVPTIAVGQAVHAARDRGARPLHPRRLRRLPLADDPAAPRRDGALRRLLEGRRVRLRPPVPVGLEAHRPGPAARGRQVSGRLALRAHEAAVGDLAAARSCRRYPWLYDADARHVARRRQGHHAAPARRAVSRRVRAPRRSRSARAGGRDRRRPDARRLSRQRRPRDRRAHRLSAAARHRHQHAAAARRAAAGRAAGGRVDVPARFCAASPASTSFRRVAAAVRRRLQPSCWSGRAAMDRARAAQPRGAARSTTHPAPGRRSVEQMR